jgi:glucokinase
MRESNTFNEELILTGDFGGTKTNFGLFTGPPDALRMIAFRSYTSAEANSAIQLIERFLNEERPSSPIIKASFGVAAPVTSGVAPMVNLPWTIEAKSILTHFGFHMVHLINDLVATASAIPHLRPGQYEVLHSAKPADRGAIGLLAAGTGLGEAFLVWKGDGYLPVPSEGGHKDFAPSNKRQLGLWQFLSEKYGHVSIERVVSGPGLVDAYLFLRGESTKPEPEWLQKRFRENDPAQVISQAALDGEDAECQEALSLFVDAYGAEAGNLALQGLTTGGVYIAGGIGPKIRNALLSDSFITAYLAKGRMAPLLDRIPLRLITDPLVPLMGAAVYGGTAGEGLYPAIDPCSLFR